MKKTLILLCIFILLFSGCNNDNVTPKQTSPSTPKSTADAPKESPVKEEKHEEVNIGSFKSKMLDMTKNRVNNIKLAASKINGKVINPGDTFSFNDTVGERTPKKGYKKAPIIVHEEKDYAHGGGVCQLATAVYNAALAAGLDITERHQHTKKVPYIEEGKDATVNYDNMDLKFKNNKDRPVKIMISVIRTIITVDIISI